MLAFIIYGNFQCHMLYNLDRLHFRESRSVMLAKPSKLDEGPF